MLQDVSKRLPAEMQILDIVLRLLSRNERMSILRQAASGQGGDDVPPCDIKRVRGAALQLVSDMEEKDAIPDRCTPMSYCEKHICRPHCQLLLQLHVMLVLGDLSTELFDLVMIGLLAGMKILRWQPMGHVMYNRHTPLVANIQISSLPRLSP